jgi:hypothetical protein
MIKRPGGCIPFDGSKAKSPGGKLLDVAAVFALMMFFFDIGFAFC